MYKRAFTLMEIILVVVILGALGGLALPRFLKFMEIQRARNAINQIRLIVAAKDYFIQNRIVCPASCSWLSGCKGDAMNETLGLSIRDSNFEYSFRCAPTNKEIVAWAVIAARTSEPSFGGYAFLIDNTSPDSIRCSGSGCAFIDMPATFPL